MSAYGVFARWYDALTEDTQPVKRAEFIRTLLCRFGFESGSLLDLACGTGAVTLELARAGYDVTAVDLSAEMLSIARAKFDAAGLDALFLQQDMRRLDLYGTVDCAVCSLDGVNHLVSPGDVKKVFQKVSLFLNPGGVFVFDVNTLYKHEHILAGSDFVYELDGLFLVWRNGPGAVSGAVDMRLDFFEKEGALWRRHAEEFTERAYKTADLLRWLVQAGFELPDVLDETGAGPPEPDAQRLVLVARKAVSHG
ncbi:MAG TPA: class I SAM-dependent methyltransferase [Clostridiales bacterium]|nr:MAG: Glycine/sarcosine N-methyltransferase [Firmicutes bacterium ADurb.Bin262]HOU10021.1 class I SAM-dependent methyltransferase [Clostridiales bacterium]HQK74184.1 class I SAM-dependent methyltransferase [Clostridiales bacterium]